MSSAPKESSEPHRFLRDLFDRAVAFANPANCLARHLPKPPKGRTLLIAAGKAAASMAHAAEQAWPSSCPLSGFALTRDGHGMECRNIKVIEAAHPVPDDRGYQAARQLMEEVSALGADDLLLFLVSGGGSALLALPAPGLTMDDKKSVNRALLLSGAPIGEMNTVRKHLSAIKGGRLAAAAVPARVVTLAISDVPHDDPSVIASGPTVPDPTTAQDAIALLERYNIDPGARVMNHLHSAAAETPKPDDPLFRNTSFTLIAKPADMIEAVEAYCRSTGMNVTSLGADVEGEARIVAGSHVQMISAAEPGILISGGETTVTVAAGAKSGRGGRNCEYLLALAIALNGSPGIFAIAADTDGIDGSETNAGAVVTPDTLERARALGLDPQAMLDDHDSFTFFAKLGDLVETGPTRTNVNDFRAILKL